MTKPRGSRDTVNGAVVQRQFMRLVSRRSVRWAVGDRHGSRTEARAERLGTATGPYGGTDSAPGRNSGCDRTEVSRSHSRRPRQERRGAKGPNTMMTKEEPWDTRSR